MAPKALASPAACRLPRAEIADHARGHAARHIHFNWKTRPAAPRRNCLSACDGLGGAPRTAQIWVRGRQENEPAVRRLRALDKRPWEPCQNSLTRCIRQGHNVHVLTANHRVYRAKECPEQVFEEVPRVEPGRETIRVLAEGLIEGVPQNLPLNRTAYSARTST